MSVPEQSLGAIPPSAEGSLSQEGAVSPDTSRDTFGVGAVWTIPGSDKRVHIKTPTEIVISGGEQERVDQFFADNKAVRTFLEDNGYIFDHFREQKIVTPDTKTARGTARRARRASGDVEQSGGVAPSELEIGTVAQNNGNLEELLEAKKTARPTAPSPSVESAQVLPGKARREEPHETPPTTVKDTSWRKELDSFLEQPGAREKVQKIEGILLERWAAFSDGISQTAREGGFFVSERRRDFLWNRVVIVKLEEVLVKYLKSTSEIDEQEGQKIFKAIDRNLQERERGRTKK